MPKKKTKTIGIRIDRSVHRKLVKAKREKWNTLSGLLNELLDKEKKQ